MSAASSIHFFKEGVSFRMNHSEAVRKWIASACRASGRKTENLNYIFCSDSYLLKMNSDYLSHHYLTDVITFDNSSGGNQLEGDIFISAERVQANADKYSTSFSDELHRVMIHGLLHLLGYSDKKSKDKSEMRNAEDYWLKKRNFISSRKQ